MMRKIERENTGLLQAGQDLVVAGYAGLAGTVKLAEAAKEELSRWFSDEYMEEIADAAPLCPVSPEFWRSCGAAEWEPAGEGGILTAIWNLTGAYETGVEFYLRQIPMRQETVEVCERLELNPYRLYSENCVLLAADSGSRLVRELKQAGIPAAVIGWAEKGIARKLRHGEEAAGYLERPQPDELLKLGL